MSADWPEVRLEDVTSKLGDGLHGTPKYEENGEYYFINGNNLGNGKITIDEKTKRATKEEYLKHKKELTDRTILVSINGTIGNVGLYNGEKVFLGKSACYFNVNEDVDKQFIRYVVTSKYFQDHISSLATGSTIKNVSLKLMRNFTFRLPPLKIQKSISKILEDLDNKIELNRQTNQTLEHMAQAIFKSWFVDFEPTRAKIAAKEEWAKRSITAKAGGSDNNIKESQAAATFVERAAMAAISGRDIDSTNDSAAGALAGLDQLNPEQIQQLKTTAALFPDKLVDSELGEIPEGWEVANLKAATTKIGSGATPRGGKEAYKEEGISQIRSMNVFDGNFSMKNLAKIDEAQAAKLKNVIVAENDVLINITGASVTRCCIVPPSVLPARVNQHVCILRAKNTTINPYYIYQTLTSPMGKSALNSLAQAGATREALTKSHIEDFEVILPCEKIMNIYGQQAGSLQERIFRLSEENQTLAGMRDSLLPKLLSGELVV